MRTIVTLNPFNKTVWITSNWGNTRPGNVGIGFLVPCIVVFFVNSLKVFAQMIEPPIFLQRLRTIGNLFVANLAVADLCVTGFINPFNIAG